MKYPTITEVEGAGRLQLGKWYRFLNSPGMSAIDDSNFEEVMGIEKEILDRILERFKELGGFNLEISKKIGWKE